MLSPESPQLETDRMWLYAWNEADLEIARPIFTDPDVMRYINGGQPLGDTEIQSFIARQMNHFRSHRFCLWKLRLKASAQFAGFCGLQPLELDGRSEVEIGWRLVKECWGRGLATEAARAALHSAVNKARLERVVAIAMPENHPSLRVMEKLEMRFERATRKAGFDVVVYARKFAPQE